MKIKSFAATSRIVDREKDIAQIIDLGYVTTNS